MERAIKHLKQTFSKERIYRKKEDLDALNEIITEYNRMEQVILKRNNLFTKMFMNEFLRWTEINERPTTKAIEEIHRILEYPLEEWYHRMRKEVPYLRFRIVSTDIGLTPLYEKRSDGTIKVNTDADEINKPIIEKHMKLLERALQTEYTEAHLKSFLDQHLKSTILKYSNYE